MCRPVGLGNNDVNNVNANDNFNNNGRARGIAGQGLLGTLFDG